MDGNEKIFLGMIERLVLSAAFKAVVPGIPGELGSIPRRSRHFKKFVNVNILTFTDDKLKYYEQIPVQSNALESTQSLNTQEIAQHLLFWSGF